jgi:hypothetical protein
VLSPQLDRQANDDEADPNFTPAIEKYAKKLAGLRKPASQEAKKKLHARN